MNKIALLTDSSANLDKDILKERSIYVLRMPVNIDGKEYIEEEDISYDEFIKDMRNKAICKTSQPPIGLMTETFKKLLETYDEIIYLPISSKLSGTYQTALNIAKDFDGKITVIDSLSTAYPLGVLCLDVKKLIDDGCTTAQIVEKFKTFDPLWAALLPQDLQYLKRGGRISSAGALLANLLKIVPILKVEDGAIDVYDKVRTFKKAIAVSIDAVVDVENIDDYHFLAIHSDCIEKGLQVKKDLEERINREVEFSTIGTIVSAHTGPDTIGIGRIKKLI